MARRPRRDSRTQNLDSLLDTMANVVGILVVLMAVTQISVGEAVERIRTLEATGMTPQALRDLTLRAAGLRDELADLEARGLPPESSLDLSLEEAEALRSQRAAEIDALEDDLAAAQGELAQLRVTLRDAPAPAEPPTRSARLPDPRPAPPGARPVHVLARYGRVHVIDFELLSRQLESGIQSAVGRPSGYLRLTPQDHAWIVHYFQQRPVGTRYMRWVLFDHGPRALIARLTWRDDRVGETTSQLRRMDSAFRRALRQNDPRRTFLRFYVWGDSFEPYLEARRMAEDAGFAAWWEAFGPNEEYEGNVYQAAGASPRALVD